MIVPAKLVVTARDGGSQISLVGASGKALLTSVVFTEPRAKGATLRALKGMLGENVVVDDRTPSASSARGRPAAVASDGTPAKRAAKTTRKSSARKSTARKSTARKSSTRRSRTASAATGTRAKSVKRARKSTKAASKRQAVSES
jgi:hypothetical protein